MCSIPKFLGYVVSCAMLALLGAQSGCQSTTGKTAGQTMSDASISTAVQTKLTKRPSLEFPTHRCRYRAWCRESERGGGDRGTAGSGGPSRASSGGRRQGQQ